MLYYMLQAVSTAIFATFATLWLIEESLINLMMSTFLLVLRIACHPLMVLPTIFGVYYLIRKVWLRRRQLGDGEAIQSTGRRPSYRSPRIGSFRSMGSTSSRSNDSCDYEDDEIRGLERS
ncbi:PREDICTED: uncharacterized protein LOC108616490 [Drosophila arizonae]|uniref:Uncharacterized protein LOC108616490 n=1 Tax=Drosophila arizonae TaxID=7263 RepID=A0ABM1PJ12_DROAR|nr:PREDICTED: uncharacterized protein LOC108616490 [Drosophila arizonae]